MIAKERTKIKTIEADNAFDFDARVNGFTDQLDLKGIDYNVELHVSPKFLAVVTYKKLVRVAETLSEEYELRGERHSCIECPFYVRPTDGRVRHTKCSITKDADGNPTGEWVRKETRCCDEFYKLLQKGEIR